MKQFIKIQGTRVRLSTIKKYRVVGDHKNVLSIYYTASQRRGHDNELFTFDNEESARMILLELDQHLL